jgi:PAS domain S-box-containing protein
MNARTTLALAYALFAVPICFLLFALISTQRVTIDASRKEIAGNAYLAAAMQAQQAVYEPTGEPGDGSAGLEQWRGGVLRAADGLAIAEAKFGGFMSPESSSRRAVDALRGLAYAHGRADAAAGALRDLVAEIGDQSGLVLDTEIDSFYTIDLLAVALPEFTGRIVEIAKSPSDLIARGRLIELRERIYKDAAVARRGAPNGIIRANFEDALTALTAAANSFVPPDGRIDDQTYSQARAHSVLDNVWRMRDAARTLLADLLQRRLDRLMSERWKILAISTGLFSIAIVANHALIRRGVIKPIRDLMARQTLSEAAIKASQDSLRTVMDSIIDGVFTFDRDWSVSSFSKPAERMFGYRAEEVIGRSLRKLLRAEYERDGAPSLFFAAGPAAILGPNREMFGQRKDGSAFAIDLSVSSLPSTDGNPRFVATVRDITEKKRADAMLREAQKLQALGTLAGGIAHNFNNLLGAILGFGEFLIQDLKPGTDQHSFAERIVATSQRGRALVQQVVEFSRPNAVQPAGVRIASAIAEARDLLAATLPATTQIVVDDRAEDAMISANQGQIVQMLVSLCVNGSDSLEGNPGIVRIDVDLYGTAQHEWNGAAQILIGSLPLQACVSLTVSDTGGGIPDSSLPQIFDPFFTTKIKGIGTGLGLAIVHRIVIEHAGAIIVRTREGKGTSFEVVLPLAETKTRERHDFRA